MNDSFDRFCKSIAEESVPRRESLRRMGTALIGTVLAPFMLGHETASASPDSRSRRRRSELGLRRPGTNAKLDPCVAFCNRCSTKSRRDQCLSVCRACNNDPRRLKGSCGRYVCCGSGQSYCRGTCVDLKSDSSNCGACGRVCGTGETCVNGRCQSGGGNVCPQGQTRCGDTCVVLSTNDLNCGACGFACTDGTACVNGTCSGCQPGLSKCGDTCVNLMGDDRNNCGACGNVCPERTHCVFGRCSEPSGDEPCPNGATRCHGICVNVSVDTMNCGGCGIVCGDFQTCTAGVCEYPY